MRKKRESHQSKLLTSVRLYFTYWTKRRGKEMGWVLKNACMTYGVSEEKALMMLREVL